MILGKVVSSRVRKIQRACATYPIRPSALVRQNTLLIGRSTSNCYGGQSKVRADIGLVDWAKDARYSW